MSVEYKTRHEFHRQRLTRKALSHDPFQQLQQWLQEAKKEIKNFNAMSLATCNKDGQVSIRTVLLKEVEKSGLIFFTDSRSRKAQQLQENPQAALLFYWEALERQVRIEGTVSKIDRAHCHHYFQSRPREAQISSHTSHQSQPVASRAVLEERASALHSQWHGKDIETPDHWQGYLLQPQYWEFWQGGAHRLHDRFCYTEIENNWEITRLSP